MSMFVKPTTIREINTFVDQVIHEAKERRGYEYFSTDLSFCPSDSMNKIRLTMSFSLNMEDTNTFETARGNDFDELISQLVEIFNEKLPPREKAEKIALNRLLEKAAMTSDKIAERIPEYAELAETLREHMRNNLLEDCS